MKIALVTYPLNASFVVFKQTSGKSSITLTDIERALAEFGVVTIVWLIFALDISDGVIILGIVRHHLRSIGT